VLLFHGVAEAQAGRRTEQITARFEVAEVIDAPEVGCGVMAVHATVRVRVIATEEGDYDARDLYVAWLSCGASRSMLEEQLVGHRFRARLRRWIHPRERDLPLERQPRFFVRGRAEPLEQDRP
jgi:hypothetical protein